MEEDGLFTIIKVARNEDLFKQIGKDIYFDLVDHDKVPSFRVLKKTSFCEFKEEIAEKFGVPAQFQRFWLCSKRQNQTYRLNRPLSPREETESVGLLFPNNGKLFLEVEIGRSNQPIAPPPKSDEDIILFFKIYDVLKEEIRFVGRMFVKVTETPAAILTNLNEMAGFSPEEDIELYEEIKFEPTVMCLKIDKNATFLDSELGDGDIICFQKSQAQKSVQCFYPDVCSFLQFVRVRQEKSSSSFAQFDPLFMDIQNCLQEKTTQSSFGEKEIADAQTVFKTCLSMSLTSVIRSGKAHELKSAISLLLTTKAIPISMVEEAINFITNFDQRCEEYEAANRDLNEAQVKEDTIAELKTTLKQLSSKFVPVRNQAVAVDTEIRRQENLLAEMKAEREKLEKRLTEVVEQATSSKQALLSAEDDMKIYKIKKEKAEKTVKKIHTSWESLKDHDSATK